MCELDVAENLWDGQGERGLRKVEDDYGQFPRVAEVFQPVQKVRGKWNIVHTGNQEHAYISD
jgi:hypothetical protein